MGTTQEFRVKVGEREAILTVKYSGWLRRKREVVYDLSQIPKQLLTSDVNNGHETHHAATRPA